jgi:hypothetical protein
MFYYFFWPLYCLSFNIRRLITLYVYSKLFKIKARPSVAFVRSMSSNSPFLKNNGAEAPKGPRPIVFKEWRDTRTFSNLKSRALTWDHPCCSGVPVVQSLLFANALWVIVCILLFLLTIVLSVLRFTASDYSLVS